MAPPGRPPLLDGVRILDLTKATSGPFATQILADLGADVIKIEDRPGSPHGRSMLEPALDLAEGMDPYFMSVNRNKRSVVLPLSEPEAYAAFLDLVTSAHAVVDNYRPGVAAKLGVDHDTLAAHNDQLVTASISGYGSDGPLRDRAAFDVCVLAETGMLSYIGKTDDAGTLQYPLLSVADLTAGLYLAISVCAALRDSGAQGRGRHIEISMFDATLSMFIGYGTALVNQGHAENVSEKGIWGCFETATETIVLAAHREPQWRALCAALERTDWLTDQRFVDADRRGQHVVDLRRLVAERLRERPSDAWAEALRAHHVPFALVRRPLEALDGPFARERGMVADADCNGSPVRLLGSPIRVDGVTATVAAPPVLGADTRDVLEKELGYPPEKADRIRRGPAR